MKKNLTKFGEELRAKRFKMQIATWTDFAKMLKISRRMLYYLITKEQTLDVKEKYREKLRRVEELNLVAKLLQTKKK